MTTRPPDLPDGPWLLAVAAPLEADAVLHALPGPGTRPDDWQPRDIGGGLHLLVTGVGKANAAAACALALRSGDFGAVLSLGICGALPARSALSIGDSIAATRSVYADEGMLLPDGSFVGCAGMGFPLGPFDDRGIRPNPGLLERLAPLVTVAAPIATVSTCSATDALAHAVAGRTGALAEAMEGAAVGQVASRLGVPFLELRVVSNTTGDRDAQVWSIGPALGRVGELAAGIGALLAR